MTPSTFHCFLELPQEVRDLIWLFALQHVHRERRFKVSLWNRGQGPANAWWANFATEVDDFRPFIEHKRALMRIIASCREARKQHEVLQRKQLAPISETPAPDNKWCNRREMEFRRLVISTLNLDLGTFDVGSLAGQWRNNSELLLPRNLPSTGINQHIRHVEFRLGEFAKLLEDLTIDRAMYHPSAVGADFRRLLLGPLAAPGSRLQTITMRFPVSDNGMDLGSMFTSMFQEVEIMFQAVEEFIKHADEHLERYINRLHRPEPEWPPRLDLGWEERFLDAPFRLRDRVRQKPAYNVPRWTLEERTEWLEQIRTFWEHEIRWELGS